MSSKFFNNPNAFRVFCLLLHWGLLKRFHIKGICGFQRSIVFYCNNNNNQKVDSFISEINFSFFFCVPSMMIHYNGTGKIVNIQIDILYREREFFCLFELIYNVSELHAF